MEIFHVFTLREVLNETTRAHGGGGGDEDAILDKRCCLRGGGLRAGLLPGIFRGVALSSVDDCVVVIVGGSGITATMFSSSLAEWSCDDFASWAILFCHGLARQNMTL